MVTNSGKNGETKRSLTKPDIILHSIECLLRFQFQSVNIASNNKENLSLYKNLNLKSAGEDKY